MAVPLTRRALLSGLAASAAVPAAAAQAAMSASTLARAILEQHGASAPHHDRVGIADFALSSRQPRFWIIDLVAGQTRRHLCAHGRGSDPAHSGRLQRFSNLPGSCATSEGVYLTGAPYVGQHGRSQRLVGLESSNSNAEARAIVVHAAWYVSESMARTHGKIGRSEGCFAFDAADLDDVLASLGSGRLIAAGRYDIAA